MENKKYKLTGITTRYGGKTLYRIQALKNFGKFVKEGDLGGYVESEDNLSQDGNCWVDDNAKVCDSARVCKNARVYDDACIYDKARVGGNACIFGNAWVFDNACVYGDVCVYDHTVVHDNAIVYGNANIGDNAIICGDATVCGNDWIETDGYINNNNDIFTISNLINDELHITFYKTVDGDIYVYFDWFYNCKHKSIEKSGRFTIDYSVENFENELKKCNNGVLYDNYIFNTRGQSELHVQQCKNAARLAKQYFNANI